MPRSRNYGTAWFVALAFCGAVAAGPAPGAASLVQTPELLRYQFHEGDTFEYQIDQNISQHIEVMGQSFDQSVLQSFEVRWTVESVSDEGEANVRLEFDRIYFTIDGLFQVRYDSGNPQPPEIEEIAPLFDLFDAMAELEVTMVVDPRGQVRDVTGYDSIVELVPAAQQLGADVNQDTFRLLVTGGVILPEEPVDEGDTWDQDFDILAGPGRVTGTAHYTAGGLTERGGYACREIHATSDSEYVIDPLSPGGQLLGPDAEVTLGENESRVYFDNERGRFIGSHDVQPLTMQVMGATIEMEVEATYQLTGVTGTEE